MATMQNTEKPKKPKKPDADDAVPGVKLWLVLMKAHQSMLAYAERSIKASGLGESDFRVLEVLLHKGGMPVNELGPRVFLTPGSISVAVERLHKQSFVTRTEDTNDRRVRQVELTAKGRVLIERIFAAHAKEMNALADGMTEKERRRLMEGLKFLGLRAAEAMSSRKK